ncbi:MAG: RHS repeat domain-containing protein [Candidatus Acidiferrales bacterium]
MRGKFLIGWQPTPGGGWTDSPTPASVGHFDGTSTNNWSLAFDTYATTVTDPTSVPRTTTFWQTGLWDDGLPKQTQIGSPVLRTMLKEWEVTGAEANPGIMRVTTTLNDSGQQSKVEYDYATFGNVAAVVEFDFGFVLKRKAITNYVTESSYTDRHILNLPANVTVFEGFNDAKSRTEYTFDGATLGLVSGASNHDDTNYGTGFVYRGLVTTVTRYTNAAIPSGAITNTSTYDMLGNLRTESADCCVQKVYQYSSETQFSQPDSIVRGSGTTLTTSATYDDHTSLLASSTDENSKTTSYGYDVMDRATTVTRSDGTQITTSYDDSSATASTTTTTPIEAGKSVKRTTEVDGYGRTKRVITTDAADVIHSKVDTLYDSVGRTSKVSNPYTGASASFWTETQYDAIGRPTKVIPPDGTPTANHIAYSYSGNATIVTDQSGKQRKFKSDALGRQIEVTEPDPANNNSLTLVTSYSYDPMDNLTQITQGAQTRTYVFDGLSRKTSETTPEAGTVSYQYNNDGLMTTRTDARGVITTYGYDTALNRLTSISYNVSCCTSTVPATPTVTYTYGTSAASNNNGRLIKVTDGPGEENYSYDSLGRTTQVQKKINAVTYTTSYTHNLAGSVVTTTYPSGFTVKQEYDAIGRVQAVKNNATGASFVAGATYNAANQLTGFSYGNGVSALHHYSADRLQLIELAHKLGETFLVDLSYDYNQGGNNNGQIVQIRDWVDTGRKATYTYDALHRLKTAVTAGSASSPQWGLAMSYDRYGNRTAQSVTVGTAPSHSAAVSATTNRFTDTGYAYDASGNMTADGVATMVYDAEARMTQSTVAGAATNYTYDGGGLRVQRIKGGTTTVYLFAGSQVLAEYENGALAREFIYFRARQVALRLAADDMRYIHHDHLSIRLYTDESGAVVGTQGHFPYGEGWYSTGGTTERVFTTYDHDADSADDYAVHRFHNCRLGRFRTADPVRGNFRNPQRLNRYAYVMDDPTNRTDPLGLDLFDDVVADMNRDMYMWATGSYYYDVSSGQGYYDSMFEVDGGGYGFGGGGTGQLGPQPETPEQRRQRCESEYQMCLANRSSNYRRCLEQADQWYGDCVTHCFGDADG